jgi:hypothetical protein
VISPETGPAEVTPQRIEGLCETLLEAGPALAERDAAELATALGRVGERFLDPGDALRLEALELLPEASGLSPAMCVAVLDGMARDWVPSRLARLLVEELGEPAALDGFRGAARSAEDGGGRRVLALGPALCVQIVAGSVPGVAVSALLRSLLVKGPTLIKPGRGDVVLPVLFARGLADADRGLAAALAVVYWPGGSPAVERAALSRADVVTVYGSDETVADLRSMVPITARFVAYHHRVSVGVVARESLTAARLPDVAAEAAKAMALFDQRGCVSPQTFFVEEGGEGSPEVFAETMARSLERLESTLPTGPLTAAEASSLHQARGTAELMAAGSGGRVFHGDAHAWTVLFDHGEPTARGRLPAPGAGRVARVRPIPSLAALPRLLAPLTGHLQTVGFAGPGDRARALAHSLGRVGVSRVVPFAAVAFPPPWWHHDGGGPLRDLVRWIDLEAD